MKDAALEGESRAGPGSQGKGEKPGGCRKARRVLRPTCLLSHDS